MKKLASGTKSAKQDVNTLSLADSIGHLPPTIPEPQVMKKYGVQKYIDFLLFFCYLSSYFCSCLISSVFNTELKC